MLKAAYRHVGYDEGKMMKKFGILTALTITLCVLVFVLSGCQQLGETKAEARRRRIRNSRIDQRTLKEDVEMFFHADEPSKLTERRIQ